MLLVKVRRPPRGFLTTTSTSTVEDDDSRCRFQAIVFHGGGQQRRRHEYTFPAGGEAGRYGGRGCAIVLGEPTAANACLFVPSDGPLEHSTVLRCHGDTELSLEVNHRRFEVGQPLSLWSINGHRHWACRFALRSDGTLAPVMQSGDDGQQQRLVVGVRAAGGRELVLVDHTDAARRLVFADPRTAREYQDELAAIWQVERMKQEEMKNDALDRCDGAMRAKLVEDGFVRLPQAVSPALVRAARQEINRQLGSSNRSAESFKARSFPGHTSVTSLFNGSMLPHVLRELLGGSRPYSVDRGQLALRFPGDMCPGDSCDFSPGVYENLRKHWHIDGCPSDFLPGVTDHFGEIHNFDALIGILLSDIDDEMSGEVCFYPGSHMALAEHFGRDEYLERLRAHGNSALPVGDATDSLFSRPPSHVIGRAGDVVIANYMTAHFVAPNTSPDIRYAVYFRVHGPSFDGMRGHDPRPMLEPWRNWRVPTTCQQQEAAFFADDDIHPPGDDTDDDVQHLMEMGFTEANCVDALAAARRSEINRRGSSTTQLSAALDTLLQDGEGRNEQPSSHGGDHGGAAIDGMRRRTEINERFMSMDNDHTMPDIA